MLSLVIGPPASWSLVGILIAVIVAAALVAIACIALRKFGVTIPDWLVQVFWVVVIAFVCITAVRLIASM